MRDDGWRYGIRVNHRDLAHCDWKRTPDGAIDRYRTVAGAVAALVTYGYRDDTRVDVPRSAYVAHLAPEAR